MLHLWLVALDSKPEVWNFTFSWAPCSSLSFDNMCELFMHKSPFLFRYQIKLLKKTLYSNTWNYFQLLTCRLTTTGCLTNGSTAWCGSWSGAWWPTRPPPRHSSSTSPASRYKVTGQYNNQVRVEYGSIFSTLLGYYDRPTDQKTGMRGHREVTLPTTLLSLFRRTVKKCGNSSANTS